VSKEGLRPSVVENGAHPGTGPLRKGNTAEAAKIGRETSFAQQRLWFLDQLEPGNPAYNDQIAVGLKGSLDVEALEAGLTEIARRHETLRTTFEMRGEEPRQLVSPPARLRLTPVNLEELPEEQRQAEALRWVAQEAEHRFDLSEGPLLRTILLRLDDQRHVLILTMHHIITDGWSKGVLFRELAALYRAFSSGQPSPLADLPIQYGDFARWQREWLRGEALEIQLSYWKRKLGGELPVFNLPTDRPRPIVQSFRGARQSLFLPREMTEALKSLGFDEGATLYMTLLAAFKILLQRHTGQDDIVVGTTITGRTHVETEGLIGFFVNLLVLRTDLSGNPRFRELLRRVRDVALEAYAHQDLPFEKLVDELRPERNLSRNPLVQVLFVMQKLPWSEVSFPGLQVTVLDPGTDVARFDLAVFVSESEGGWLVNWVYNAELFEAATIDAMCRRYEKLLRSIVENRDARLEELEMLSETEKQRLREGRNERLQAQSLRLRSMRRKAIDLSSWNEVRIRTLDGDDLLPLVIEPTDETVELASWAEREKALLESRLLRHGAILFRAFGLKSAAEFEQFAERLCPELFGEYGDLPRESVGGKVYGSTWYPADQAILFHNESSHMHRWPMKIWFFCVHVAESGGETPIVDCRRVYQRLDPNLRRRFSEKGLMYVRNYTEGLDVSWQSFYGTGDRSDVERICRQAGADFEWTRGNGLRTRQLCPAVVRHPQTGEMVFFNQVQLHHVRCLDPAVRESLLSMMPEEALPRNVYYGDGTPIEDSVVDEIAHISRGAAVQFPWQRGDVLMINNMLVAHARNPYVGARKIVVAMGQMIEKSDISS